MTTIEGVMEDLAGLEIVDDESPFFDVNEFTLVGRVLSDRRINLDAMYKTLIPVWQPGKGVYYEEIGAGRFLLKLFHAYDVEQILVRQPWSFQKQAILLRHISVGDNPATIELNLYDIWVLALNLPSYLMTESVARQLGEFLGLFIQADKNNGPRRKFLRLKVRINVLRPLCRSKRITRGGQTLAEVHFKYEKLPIFCYLCGILGHTDRSCALNFQEGGRPVVLGWGPELKASRGSILHVDDPWRRTADGAQWLASQANGGGGKVVSGEGWVASKGGVVPFKGFNSGPGGDWEVGGSSANGVSVNSFSRSLMLRRPLAEITNDLAEDGNMDTVTDSKKRQRSLMNVEVGGVDFMESSQNKMISAGPAQQASREQ